MNSPPVLYLEDDDDDDDNEQNQYFGTNRSLSVASSSNDMNVPRKKRKLTNVNVRINPSIVNWSKRQRNGHYQPQLSQNFIDNDPDPEPILLDPDEYIIEEPDTPSFRSFDWTIQPTPAPVLPSSPVKTATRVSTILTSNVNNIAKRSLDNSHTISNERFIQQQKKPIAIPAPRPSLALLPLPKPTSSLSRPNVQRGRPVKNSRILHTQSTSPPLPPRQRPEPETSRRPPSTATTVNPPPINNSTSEIRRQILNGTGIFSAFHDSKYYRCNICKFKSVTSSTLLQHLFTHMFFCDQCSFYTYSHYNLSQHLFEKHSINLIEDITEPLNPKAFDLLYVTRCVDGTFALCMDSSLTQTNKIANTTDQRLIISSATLNEQPQNKSSTKKIIKQKELPTEEDNEVVFVPEKRDAPVRSKVKEKTNQTYALMKHRRCYSLKKSTCLHSLTLEYNICREHTIRHLSKTEDILKRRRFLRKFSKTRLIDEIANCLRTIVNQIVDNEENNDQSSLVCRLPNDILSPVLSTTNLNTLTNLLKLNNKHEECMEQDQLYNSEHLLRENREHVFILSSPDLNHSEQLIISSLHSSMTNGDSIFTQTKVDKLPQTLDNTHRYLKGNLNTPTQLNKPNPKVQKKIDPPPQPQPKLVPLRPVIPKPNLVSPSVIILD